MKIIEKVSYFIGRGKRARQEMYEDQYYQDIKNILEANPDNIDKKDFGGCYIVYSSVIKQEGKRLYISPFYSLSPGHILLNGMDVSYNVSQAFPNRTFKMAQGAYQNKFQQNKVAGK